jgi:AcrR family transcriptional regulator
MGKQICNMKSRYHLRVARKRTRTYVKAARAASEAETRDRIVEALIALHEEIGPARTTVKAVAERAGVQRLTVYRHFPNELEMIAACSGRWAERVPLPDLSAIETSEPRQRSREILLALYRYYRTGAPMLSKVLVDATHVEAVRVHMQPLAGYLDTLVEELAKGWKGRSQRRRATLRHAVQFTTWQSLSALTSDDAEAVDLVFHWCEVTPAAEPRAAPATRSRRSSPGS